MYELIARPLQFFYELWPNYAGAISLLTLTIMVLLLPLTLKGTRSMLAMQKLQPELKKLQAKHKDDRQALNEAMMAFYKENNINPVSGCLPLLLQMPVFFILYQTLYQLINRQSFGFDMGSAVARSATGVDGGAGAGVWERFGNFDPNYIEESSQLYQDLSSSRTMESFGIDLAESASRAIGQGAGHAFPYIVMILAVTATSYYQQRQISGRNPNAEVNPQQQMLMRILPLFFAFISFTLPAFIVVYFLVSNLFRIGQQALITRTMYRDDDGPVSTTGRESDTSSAGSKPKGLFSQIKELSAAGPAGGSAKGGGTKTATSAAGTKGATTTSTSKQATSGPSRTAPSNANRSKSKKKRK